MLVSLRADMGSADLLHNRDRHGPWAAAHRLLQSFENSASMRFQARSAWVGSQTGESGTHQPWSAGKTSISAGRWAASAALRNSSLALGSFSSSLQIGRASCRERVCQYV